MSTALLRGFALLGLSCTLAATPALAQSEAPQRFVSYADLDLTTRAGQDMLHSRVLHAVDDVCGRPAPGDFGPMREVIMNCRNTARISTRSQVQMALANAHGGAALARNEVKIAPRAR
ncbi:UrcA family protein [Novosphingobium rosa]|uniref:UrcA family protein n=1 Tax=Novosphingobium rosa TaxID=76978 RepID=UPI000831C236|nr:UrcA family protein [Novosphingobium rosa]